jgi:hypothetical protein
MKRWLLLAVMLVGCGPAATSPFYARDGGCDPTDAQPPARSLQGHSAAPGAGQPDFAVAWTGGSGCTRTRNADGTQTQECSHADDRGVRDSNITLQLAAPPRDGAVLRLGADFLVSVEGTSVSGAVPTTIADADRGDATITVSSALGGGLTLELNGTACNGLAGESSSWVVFNGVAVTVVP